MRKLSMELDELLTKTTIGKFFSKLSVSTKVSNSLTFFHIQLISLKISELDLGSQFPEIKSLELSSAELHPTEGFIENLDILMNLHYKGDFLLKIDADMVLGKKGSLTLRGDCDAFQLMIFSLNDNKHFSKTTDGKGEASIYEETIYTLVN